MRARPGPPARLVRSALFGILFAACASASNEPPARRTGPAPVEADVHFIQGMIAHHQQALAMTALVAERTRSGDIHLLAERIEVSQQDEIELMGRWLAAYGQGAAATGSHDHAAGHSGPMPGMLSEAEMARLAASSGLAFDRLFLESMIRHHQGALTMVGDLLAAPGAGQQVDIFRIASEVDSDQRIEIQRMERMLAEMG